MTDTDETQMFGDKRRLANGASRKEHKNDAKRNATRRLQTVNHPNRSPWIHSRTLMVIDIVIIQSYLWVYTAEARAGLVFRGRDICRHTPGFWQDSPFVISSIEP